VNIFIDCEWNEFGGDLISMALCSEEGEEFYEVLPCDNPGEWVSENVMPILGKEPITIGLFRRRLEVFLAQFDSVNIIADWPEDISRFCDALITGPGQRLNTPPLSMQVVQITTYSEKPHNALYDARGILKAVCG